ncbi:hypothetical protein [Nodosilinea nodulosa]|uniref:hypothetical protein n=1 Tax=Nodosilinea nodulosa TaxID=416001 RepID=UPI0002D8E6B9|nr:hypothetical protein [Nodosilinea nodulosa]
MTVTPDQTLAQSQDCSPALESEMTTRPIYGDPDYRGSGKLQGNVAPIIGSSIGRSVAVYCAEEGADVAIAYLDAYYMAGQVLHSNGGVVNEGY